MITKLFDLRPKASSKATHHQTTYYPKRSNVLRRNTIVLYLLIHETVLRLRRIIRHFDLIVNNVVHLAILAQLLHQFADGDAAEIGRQPGQMLDVAVILVDRSAFVLGVCEHEDVLRDDLAGTFGDFPDFVVFADEGAVFGDGAALGDEPGHVEHFELAVVIVPWMISIGEEEGRKNKEEKQGYLPPARGFGMLAAIILAHNLGTIMLSGGPARDLDPLGVRFQLAKSLHQGAANHGRPAVRRLHDFDRRINSCTNGLAKIRILSKSADKKYRFNFLLGSSDLTSDECYNLFDNGIEDRFDLSAAHFELAPSDTL